MKSLRKLFIIFVMLLIAAPAMAIVYGDCPDFGPEWTCEGRVEFSDLATLDENGSVIPGGPLSDELNDWSPVPIVPFHNFELNNGQFQVRRFPDGSGHVRVHNNIGLAVYQPRAWSVYCNDVEQGCPEYNVGKRQFFADFDGDGVPVYDQIMFTPIDVNRMTVTWENKGLIADSHFQSYLAMYTGYQLFPMNFWDFSHGFVDDSDMIFTFPMNVLPDLGVQTVKFHLDADDPSGGYAVYKTYNVTTTEPLPTVSVTKEVDGVTKITIGAVEKKIGLKITWDDPPFKDIMKPGIQLKVYIGSNAWTTLDGHEIYYWIDCPAQMHKMLIPSDSWNELKTALLNEGYTKAYVVIVYRTLETGGGLDEGVFMNRGHSDPVEVPLT